MFLTGNIGAELCTKRDSGGLGWNGVAKQSTALSLIVDGIQSKVRSLIMAGGHGRHEQIRAGPKYRTRVDEFLVSVI